MEGKSHFISDKRKAKLTIYEVEDENQDIAMQEILSYKIGKSTIRFDTPNSTAMYLNASERELAEAKSIYKILIEPKVSTRENYDLSGAEISQLYDYLEHIKISVIMAYTAVECLCNALIPYDYSYVESSRDGERLWDFTEIQRWKSTTQKLRQILPKALGMKDPGNFKFYSPFCKLEDLRNQVIHTRKFLPKNVRPADRVDYQLLQPRVFKLISSATGLIKEIHAVLPYNSEMPMLYNTEDITKIKVKTWGDVGVQHNGKWRNKNM